MGAIRKHDVDVRVARQTGALQRENARRAHRAAHHWRRGGGEHQIGGVASALHPAPHCHHHRCRHIGIERGVLCDVTRVHNLGEDSKLVQAADEVPWVHACYTRQVCGADSERRRTRVGHEATGARLADANLRRADGSAVHEQRSRAPVESGGDVLPLPGSCGAPAARDGPGRGDRRVVGAGGAGSRGVRSREPEPAAEPEFKAAARVDREQVTERATGICTGGAHQRLVPVGCEGPVVVRDGCRTAL